MKGQEDYQIDIKNNKIKQGFLIKRSRVLKEWKQRWMVLTKTFLYSFTHKQVYKKPTEKIPLKDVSTIKSYYKNQYNRPQVIRVQSDDADFYLSAKNHQQKWAWMTAIQKMTDLQVCPQQQGVDTHNLIRETIRMSSAIRKTINFKNQRKQVQVPKDLMKRLNIMLQSKAYQAVVIPSLPVIKQVCEQSPRNMIRQQIKQVFIEKQKIIQKQKIVYVPDIKQKIVYVPEIKEKIVYVPQIKQVVKTVYVNKQKPLQQNSSQILLFFENIMQIKCQNPKPLVQFIVFLVFTEIQKYTEFVLSFATNFNIQQSFSNAFLQVLNQETQQQKLNSYIKFIIILYENNYEYFYTNDLKLLFEILLREIQMNRSNFNQYLIINLFNILAQKKWFIQLKHRRQELVEAMKDVKSWTTDTQSKYLVDELLQKL